MLLGSVGEKAEVTDAHETVGQHMEEEAANKLLEFGGHITIFESNKTRVIG